MGLLHALEIIHMQSQVHAVGQVHFAGLLVLSQAATETFQALLFPFPHSLGSHAKAL